MFSSCALAEESEAAATPSARIAATWSRISAISGETTSVSPPSTTAGKLIAERLARPGRHDGQHVGARHDRRDHLVLPRPQRGEAEGFAQRVAEGLSASSYFFPSLSRIASVLSRSAFSRMKPAASFWS